MKVYLDIILFENLCMNYIILFATGIVLKRKVNHVRLIISSLLGSIYAIIIYLKVIGISSNIIMKILLSIAMIWLAFNESNYKMFLKDLLMFYVMSFVFGGCSIALIYFINPDKVQIKDGVLVGLYPIKVTLLAGAIAFISIQIAFKITKNKLSAEDMICKIEICFDDKKVKVRALIDSGNMLRDPISGYPVVIVEKNKMSNILSEKLLKLIEKIEGGDLINNDFNGIESRLRLIPFSSLGKQNGMLVGIRVDEVKIKYRDKEESLNNIIVGIYNKRITKENRYNALIGLDLLENDNRTEYIKSNKIKVNL